MNQFSWAFFNQVLDFCSREGDGTLLQYSCLENPMDGGAWWAAIYVEMGPGEPKKTEALFSDTDHVILAVRNKSGFYTGGSSTRVSQIVGRLIGTAKSGIEKERRAANLIQKRVAAELINACAGTARQTASSSAARQNRRRTPTTLLFLTAPAP